MARAGDSGTSGRTGRRGRKTYLFWAARQRGRIFRGKCRAGQKGIEQGAGSSITESCSTRLTRRRRRSRWARPRFPSCSAVPPAWRAARTHLAPDRPTPPNLQPPPRREPSTTPGRKGGRLSRYARDTRADRATPWRPALPSGRCSPFPGTGCSRPPLAPLACPCATGRQGDRHVNHWPDPRGAAVRQIAGPAIQRQSPSAAQRLGSTDAGRRPSAEEPFDQAHHCQYIAKIAESASIATGTSTAEFGRFFNSGGAV